MTKIKVAVKTWYEVEIPVESFDCIRTDKMSIAKSTALIMAALDEQGIPADEIVGVRPI